MKLPDGWALTTVGEIASVTGGKRLPAGHVYSASPTAWPYIRVSDFADGSVATEELKYIEEDTHRQISRYTVQQGDLYISIAGTIGRVGRIPRELAGANLTENAARVRPQGVAAPDFLRLALTSPRAQMAMAEQQVSTTQPKLALFRIEGLELALPPLNEQRRIVDKIEALTARSRRAKEALDAVPALLDKLRQSILAAAFRGDLTKEWRAAHPDVEPASVLLDRIRKERRARWEEAELAKMRAKGSLPKDDKWKSKYVEPEPVNTDDLPELPEGWAWARLLDHADVVDPNPSHRNPEYVQDGFPFVSTAEFIDNEGVLLESTRKVTLETVLEQEARCNFSARTILFSRKGTIGKTRLFPAGHRLALLDSLCTITPDQPLHVEFVNLALRSQLVVQQVEQATRGVALPQLSVGRVRELCVPIAPVEEQSVICAAVKQALEKVALLSGLLAACVSGLAASDQSILAKAFRGELVPQDPNDEPASALLERIRAERKSGAATSATKKTRARRATKASKRATG